MASGFIALAIAWLTTAFFRAQVVQNEEYSLQSTRNRLRAIPLVAPRGIVYDRRGNVIAESVPGYSVSLLSPSADSLRSTLRRLATMIALSDDQIEHAVRRFRREPNRPTVVLSDATFDQVSVLEEQRTEFPGLIIQAAPKRFYPDGAAVSAFVGYTGEITETELNSPTYEGYQSGQQIGKAGLERQYESELRGKEGSRFVVVDARNRVVQAAGAQPDIPAEAPPPLQTNIDLELQRFVSGLFGDSLQGGLVAMDPATGAVLAIHSAPTFDPNRFIGGIPKDYWDQLRNDPRKPLYNKALQGIYPPASTFKLATSVIALERGIVTLNDRMPLPCTGGMYYGRYFRCWEKEGHGSLTLSQAIAKSCDVYFYQLGLRLGLTNLLAGGVKLQFREKSGIDLPSESRPIWPYAVDYFNRRYGPGGWNPSVVLSLAIGQADNSQTILNMARFYSALATDGSIAKPELVRRAPERKKIFNLTAEQMTGVREALTDVVSTRGTAASARIEGVIVAGKTGTAQHHEAGKPDHAWFVGFAPLESPKIVVAVMVEYGAHGYLAARLATKAIAEYLKRPAIPPPLVGG
ncbi:MAG TPA: penicillin-binding protein 2 [Gemmatimonadaceae bacterium]|nr:penicillin-binding protein 2 [Gemmatimonadaceae bacterium]